MGDSWSGEPVEITPGTPEDVAQLRKQLIATTKSGMQSGVNPFMGQLAAQPNALTSGAANMYSQMMGMGRYSPPARQTPGSGGGGFVPSGGGGGFSGGGSGGGLTPTPNPIPDPAPAPGPNPNIHPSRYGGTSFSGQMGRTMGGPGSTDDILRALMLLRSRGGVVGGGGPSPAGQMADQTRGQAYSR